MRYSDYVNINFVRSTFFGTLQLCARFVTGMNRAYQSPVHMKKMIVIWRRG